MEILTLLLKPKALKLSQMPRTSNRPSGESVRRARSKLLASTKSTHCKGAMQMVHPQSRACVLGMLAHSPAAHMR